MRIGQIFSLAMIAAAMSMAPEAMAQTSGTGQQPPRPQATDSTRNQQDPDARQGQVYTDSTQRVLTNQNPQSNPGQTGTQQNMTGTQGNQQNMTGAQQNRTGNQLSQPGTTGNQQNLNNPSNAGTTGTQQGQQGNQGSQWNQSDPGNTGTATRTPMRVRKDSGL